MAQPEEKVRRRWFRRKDAVPETPNGDLVIAQKQIRVSEDFRLGLRAWWPMQMEPLYGANVQEAQSGDYGYLYLHQAAVRTVVDFLATNMAPLNVKTYRKTPSGDPQELPRHEAALLLQNPSSSMSRWDLIHGTVSSLAVYENAFWWLKRVGTAREIRLLPPEAVRVMGDPWLGPSRYRIRPAAVDSQSMEFYLGTDEVVHFKTWNPRDLRIGLSKLEGLRSVLRDDALAQVSRATAWANAAYIPDVIERPLEAPDWDEDAQARFRDDFQQTHGGPGRAGKTGVLEEGMKMNWGPDRRPWDTEFVTGRKFTLEEVARAYHIPLSMVGLMSNANYKATSEERRTLYADVLDSIIVMIEQQLGMTYLNWFDDIEGVYFKFNVKEKLRGSFEEEAEVLTKSVGAPWLTQAEARKLQDLPHLEGTDELILPLNVTRGGQPNPTTPLETPGGALYGATSKAADNEHDLHQQFLTRARANFEAQTRQIVARNFERQREAGFGSSPIERWDREMGDDLFKMGVLTSAFFGNDAADRIGATYDQARTEAFLAEGAKINAQLINRATKGYLEAEEAATVYESAITTRAPQIAVERTTANMNFGIQEAGRQVTTSYKQWHVNSRNPRSSHASVDGEQVPMDEAFSNGLRYPGDPAGSTEETAGCTCTMTVTGQGA